MKSCKCSRRRQSQPRHGRAGGKVRSLERATRKIDEEKTTRSLKVDGSSNVRKILDDPGFWDLERHTWKRWRLICRSWRDGELPHQAVGQRRSTTSSQDKALLKQYEVNLTNGRERCSDPKTEQASNIQREERPRRASKTAGMSFQLWPANGPYTPPAREGRARWGDKKPNGSHHICCTRYASGPWVAKEDIHCSLPA